LQKRSLPLPYFGFLWLVVEKCPNSFLSKPACLATSEVQRDFEIAFMLAKAIWVMQGLF